MPKMLHIFFHFQNKMATQKFASFDKFFFKHTAMTAVTIQFNKIVLSEVKRYYSHHTEKSKQTLANPIYILWSDE